MNNSEDNYNKMNYKFSALENNINSINSIVSSVGGTIGPMGLDCMIVDDNGNSVITNDGITILNEISVTHPAALLLKDAVMAQQRDVGDGTTTMTIIIGRILNKALEYAQKGVSIHTIINGIKLGIKKSKEVLEYNSILIQNENSYLLEKIAYIAARENKWISDLIFKSINIIGLDAIKSGRIRLADCIEILEDSINETFDGIVIDQYPKHSFKNNNVIEAKILFFEDLLDIDNLGKEALTTEKGFNKYIESLEELKSWAEKIVKLDIDLFLCDRGINPEVEQILIDGGVHIVTRVLQRQLKKAARYCGGMSITKQILKKSNIELENYCGYAKSIIFDDEKELIRIQYGKGEPHISIVISGSTPEIIRERGRIAMDCASAVQLSIINGIVPGGGASEIHCVSILEEFKNSTYEMEKYGIDCVIEGIKGPFLQMVENAGFNSLDIFDKIINEKKVSKNKFQTIDFSNGNLIDTKNNKIYDPLEVKISALNKTLEIVEAILRVNIILKGKSH